MGIRKNVLCSFTHSYTHDSSVILLITYIGDLIPAAMNRKVRTPPTAYRVYSLLGFKGKMALKMVLKDKQYWIVYPILLFIQIIYLILKVWVEKSGIQMEGN